MNRSTSPLSGRGALLALALLTAFLAFAQPDACREGAVQALTLCGRSLLPALFPFLIVSSLIVDTGASASLGILLRPVARLLGLPDAAGGVLLIGLTGGFAPAAAAAGGLYRRGELNAVETARLLPACICSGPSFVILAVGSAMLGSEMLGALLFLCQAAACLGCGIFLRLVKSLIGAPALFRHGQTGTPQAAAPQRAGEISAAKAALFSAAARGGAKPVSAPGAGAAQAPSLYRSLGDATLIFLRLCGCVVYFRFLSGGIAAFLPPQWAAFPVMLCEVSSGCAAAAGLGPQAAYWCCAVLSLQSFSVLMQVRSLVPQKVSFRPLLAARLVHLPLSLLLLHFLLRLVPAQTVYSSLSPRVLTLARCGPGTALWLLLACCFCAAQLARALHPEQNPL
ncbi:MAG: hypothetical protein LKJ90_07850 [Faecalibacterium sp.]|nr:hypothetical protein [Faecalibacterium sp.]